MTDINKFYKSLFGIWLAILIGMIFVSAAGYLLTAFNSFSPVYSDQQFKKVLFSVAILIAIVILFLKRTTFSTDKIVSAATRIPKNEREGYLLRRIKQNFITIWVLGESILIIGFVELVLFAQLSSFWIYVIVSIYSVIINYPRKHFIGKCLELAGENK